MSEIPPPPFGESWKAWGERINIFLARTRDKLRSLTYGEAPADDGILLWDREKQQVVVSHDNEWQGLGHNDFGAFYTTNNFTAAAANTSYPITWSNTAASYHIEIDSTHASRIVFTHAATYQIDFSCELQSTNSSAKSIYIYPAINGTALPYSTMVHAISTNNTSKVVTRSGIFTVEEGDYLEAMYAVTDVALKIQGSAATAFSPAAPSATIMVSEVKV